MRFNVFPVSVTQKRTVRTVRQATLFLDIRTTQLSDWLLEQRCSDNRGSTVATMESSKVRAVHYTNSLSTKDG